MPAQGTSAGNSVLTPTRFASINQRLEGAVHSLLSLIERADRVTDRLGGAVPQAVGKDAGRQDGGNCVAASLEAGLDDIGALESRLRVIVERMEAL